MSLQASLHFTGLVGILQTGLLAKSGLMKLLKTTPTALWVAKEFRNLRIKTLLTRAD